MKTFITTFTLLSGLSLSAAAQITPQAEMTFQKEVHDYGEIKQGGDGTCEFKFTNTGSVPLIISEAKGSCNCTVPSWPKQPIKPGESGVIKVKYGTDRIGAINKTVTVTANIEGGTKVLRIKGTVLATENQGAPLKEDGNGGFKAKLVGEDIDNKKDEKKVKNEPIPRKPKVKKKSKRTAIKYMMD